MGMGMGGYTREVDVAGWNKGWGSKIKIKIKRL